MKTGMIVSLVSLTCLLSVPASFANNFVIGDGKGEQVVVKQGWFGNQTFVAKDRLGNGVKSKKGIFGTEEKGAAILGNQVEVKKGLFGGKTYKASTILGDSVETKKNWFGYRTTKVDLSGVSGLAGQLLHKKSAPPQVLNQGNLGGAPAGQVGDAAAGTGSNLVP